MNGKKITPKSIIEWCKEYPDALEQLIHSYGHSQYKQAISDLYLIGQDLRSIETGAAVILAPLHDFDNWKSGKMSGSRSEAMREPNSKEKKRNTYVSNCCSSPLVDYGAIDVCQKCGEHCDPVLCD